MLQKEVLYESKIQCCSLLCSWGHVTLTILAQAAPDIVWKVAPNILANSSTGDTYVESFGIPDGSIPATVLAMEGVRSGFRDGRVALLNRNYASFQRVSQMLREMEERAHLSGFVLPSEEKDPHAGDSALNSTSAKSRT